MRSVQRVVFDPSVIDVSLADLEIAAAFLDGPSGAFQPKHFRTCDDFGRRIAEASASGCRIQVLGDGAERMPYEDLWVLPLDETPEPWRSRATRALRALAKFYGFPFRPGDVAYLT
ncbi:MAG TPA: hypothetical protein VLC10_00210 [Patescibacteria group bacterium]|nr:hypothetical protein [Patescibacteria group bacterium]